MNPRRALVLGLVACTAGSTRGFHQAVLRIPGHSDLGSSSRSNKADDQLRGGAFKSAIPLASRELGGCSARWGRRIRELRASAPDKEARRRKISVKQAVELWAADNLDLHRFNTKRVHVCKAETLPEILSEFWQLTSECAQDKYAAMTSGRDHAAHVLFVVARCDLLKDYGMMRHLDKVLDFCSGGCRDFGRTLTLQHYHPSFVLPPSQDRAADRSGDLARVTDFSRSPYPAFGLTVAGGSATRSDPVEIGDKVGRLRLDLELAYNSVAGCSTDDSVDAHGSEHGTIPSSPVEVEEKMTDWLSKISTTAEGAAASGGHHGRYLERAGDFVTSGFRTPEEVLSQIWSIVSQLQRKAAPSLAEERSSPARTAAGQAEDGGSLGVDGEGEGGGEGGGEEREPLASTLLVAPRLHPFNAAEFENFGLNLAIALKQTPIMDRIEVEIYHPEFVCDGGIVDPFRRSPFPTLLVKHCGLKDQLFEPSGMYRHAVPPLKLPLEVAPPTTDEAADVAGSGGGDIDPSSSAPETSTDTSAEGAQL